MGSITDGIQRFMSDVYIPATARNMSSVKISRIMLGQQGGSGTGKTWAALTFPNPVVWDRDNGLTAHAGKDIVTIPIWDSDYCLNTLKLKREGDSLGINRRDYLTKFLREEGPKLKSNQTFILDGWTTVMDDFANVFTTCYTKKNEIDDYAFWGQKLEYAIELLDLLTELPCNVVVNFHEQSQRDPKTGQLLEKLQPLDQGKIVARLQLYFSDFFRCQVFDKMVNGQPVFKKDTEGRDTKDKEVEYYWQCKSDGLANCKTRMPNAPMWLKQGYENLIYENKNKEETNKT